MFLCGIDEATGRNFEHRREWIENRILALAEIFSIEVFSYAVMHNHYHLVVYSDPLAPQQWTDLQVAERWLWLFPGKLNNPKFKLQRELRLQAIVSDKDLLATYRYRLGSISWLMRCINEPLAKKSNQEDFVKGHFWESRFTSQALLDEAAAITCMAYVDLNPIRAGLTDKLEESEHTSVHKRLLSMDDDALNSAVTAIAGKVRARTMTMPLKHYIGCLEWTGKYILHPGKATIPRDLIPVFQHLNINQDNWLVQVKAYGKNYYRAVGSIDSIKVYVDNLKQQWVKGVQSIRQLYLSAN